MIVITVSTSFLFILSYTHANQWFSPHYSIEILLLTAFVLLTQCSNLSPYLLRAAIYIMDPSLPLETKSRFGL